MPKISVIMGVFNGSNRVNRAIESILNQTYKDFELIICDDGSTDNSVNIIEEYAIQDKRIILIKNPYNMKLSVSLNNCLNVAQGEYIARMDDDDISHIDRFEKQVRFLDAHPEYSIVGTSRNMFDINGVWGSDIQNGERSKLDIYLGKNFVHPSVMMRKNAVTSVGGYSTNPEIGRTEDYDLWCKLYERGYKGYNLSDILLNYYEARDSYGKRKYKYRVCEFRLKKMWRKKLDIPFKYSINAYRPLIVGLIPAKLLITMHKYRFKPTSNQV
jgi:glycosyltransferase EpsE